MAKIVVGVDCSEHSSVALRWAARDGAARGLPVEALMAWSYLDQRAADGTQEFDPQWSGEKALARLESFVAEAMAGADLEVEVRCAVANDLPARALLDAADDAEMLVVGARGLGGFKGLLLGSVSRQVVDHAPCTVVVAR